MTSPTNVTNNSAPKAPPPNPRVQAVDFALQLATIRSTMSPKQDTDATALIADAEIIRRFIASGQA